MPAEVAIAISGGIDSMAAARLLQTQGIRPVGIHFTTGYEIATGCGAEAAEAVGRRLGIEVRTVDAAEAFRQQVVAPFADTYARGRTPNPCMVCNRAIKFGLILKIAAEMGFFHLATGHYARCRRHDDGSYRLYRGADRGKDQSYFLARLDQQALSRALFPLGALTKSDVRTLAREQGLAPACASESQDVCFIPGGDYAAFLQGLGRGAFEPGDIVDTAGRIIGRHRGLSFYTVGQRRGLNCPASEPYYVVRLEPEANRLVVGHDDALLAPGCRVAGLRWTHRPPALPAALSVQVRYRSPAVAARIFPVAADRAEIRFDSPRKAITPGQGAVFYRNDEVVGSGWIEAPLPAGP